MLFNWVHGKHYDWCYGVCHWSNWVYSLCRAIRLVNRPSIPITHKLYPNRVGFFLLYIMEKIFSNVIDSERWESVIEVVPHIEAQKHLNQWRHEYAIMILSCVPVDNQLTYLSVMRIRKTKGQ